jgi:hypothetical protein
MEGTKMAIVTRLDLARTLGIGYHELHSLERSSLTAACLANLIRNECPSQTLYIRFFTKVYDDLGKTFKGFDRLVFNRSSLLDPAYNDIYNDVIAESVRLGVGLNDYKKGSGRYQ